MEEVGVQTAVAVESKTVKMWSHTFGVCLDSTFLNTSQYCAFLCGSVVVPDGGEQSEAWAGLYRQ